MKENARLLVERSRISYGMGLSLKLKNAARVELNYCIPLRSQRGDRAVHGVQISVGAEFL